MNRKTSNSVLASKKDTKKKTGYCECCKQRYDNLKQVIFVQYYWISRYNIDNFFFQKHITSAQHENFEKNLENFKEIDQLINSELNFENFLSKLFLYLKFLIISCYI